MNKVFKLSITGIILSAFVVCFSTIAPSQVITDNDKSFVQYGNDITIDSNNRKFDS